MGFDEVDEVDEVVDALTQDGDKVDELTQDGDKVNELTQDGNKVNEVNDEDDEDDEDEVDEDEVDEGEGLYQDFDEDDLFRYVRRYDNTNGLDVEEALSQGLISVDDLVPRPKNAPTVDSFTTSELEALWEEEEF